MSLNANNWPHFQVNMVVLKYNYDFGFKLGNIYRNVYSLINYCIFYLKIILNVTVFLHFIELFLQYSKEVEIRN